MMSSDDAIDASAACKASPTATPAPAQNKHMKGAIFLGACTMMALLISTIVHATGMGSPPKENPYTARVLAHQVSPTSFGSKVAGPPPGENPCAGKKPDLPNVHCVIDGIRQAGEQSGTNVTKGYKGLLSTTAVPITVPFYQMGMCPVNVHWHLGTERYSVGQFDENGSGPYDELAGETRLGFQCSLYDENDAKFTTQYDWKYCVDMQVGQTYEVHWPHSAAGACGTPNQYQTPFYDGWFCTDGVLTDTAQQLGFQAQVFTVVNDESYYWPNLMRGMIVDGEMGQDVTKYTGSTTGMSRDNIICSQYAPVTWQVDRKCHLISASSFDKLCADMKEERDNMIDDLYPHGSRELVSVKHAANNHVY